MVSQSRERFFALLGKILICGPPFQFSPHFCILLSSLNFLLSCDFRSDICRSYSLRKTIIFGHSYGGATAQMAFNGLCDPLKHPVQPPPENLTQHPDFRLRYACEQFKKLPISVRVLGMVSFEGYVIKAKV